MISPDAPADPDAADAWEKEISRRLAEIDAALRSTMCGGHVPHELGDEAFKGESELSRLARTRGSLNQAHDRESSAQFPP